MKITKEERAAVLAKLIPKVMAQAARAKDFGIDIVGQPYEKWSFVLGLHEAESMVERLGNEEMEWR